MRVASADPRSSCPGGSVHETDEPPGSLSGHPNGKTLRVLPEMTSGYKTKACCSYGSGLAGHRATEPLTLKCSRQVHFTARAGEKARENLHDTSPCSLVTRGAFA